MNRKMLAPLTSLLPQQKNLSISGCSLRLSGTPSGTAAIGFVQRAANLVGKTALGRGWRVGTGAWGEEVLMYCIY